jgi:2-polyprenyl-3-methyl-5-hydroxy-6-metoxy-1,4-benzoquinol methylase
MERILSIYYDKHDKGRTYKKRGLLKILYELDAAKYRFCAKYVRNKRVLNVACGEGYSAEILLTGKPESVYSVDIDAEVIKQAKVNYQNAQSHFFCQDAEKLKFEDNYFDIAVSLETIEHLHNPERFLKELMRVTKPGSHIIISTPNGNIGKHGKFKASIHHIREYSTREMLALLSKFFTVEEIYHQGPFNKTRGFLRLRVISSFFFKNRVIVKRKPELSGIDNLFICRNVK